MLIIWNSISPHRAWWTVGLCGLWRWMYRDAEPLFPTWRSPRTGISSHASPGYRIAPWGICCRTHGGRSGMRREPGRFERIRRRIVSSVRSVSEMGMVKKIAESGYRSGPLVRKLSDLARRADGAISCDPERKRLLIGDQP